MPGSNEQLWQEESATRLRIIKRVSVLILIFLLFLACLSLWVTQPLFGKRDVRTDLAKADKLKLQKHVETLSQDHYPRNYQNVYNLDLTANYIRSEFEKTGGRVSEQNFNVNGSTYRNIVLNLGEPSNELIVIGAHYDAAFDTHGADDNASGIAGLLELAHLMSKEAHATPIEFVAYSLEEPPFFGTMNMGSYVHANSLNEHNVNVKLMVCLEMIGYYNDEPNSQNFPLILGRLLYPTTGNFVALVSSFTSAQTVRNFKYSMSSIDGLDTYSLNAPTFVGGIDLSDHRNYWQFGYNAVMITDTAFYRNKAYHTVGDSADKLDYAKMAKVVDAVNIAILDAAN